MQDIMVRTRIPPSPTGEDLHIGNAYTALINYIFAKQNRGQFIIRIEDTDQKRKVEGSDKQMIESLDWLGLTADEDPVKGGAYGPYVQSQRLALYKKYALELIDKNAAYYCFCTSERLNGLRTQQQAEGKPPRYDSLCRSISKAESHKRIQKGESYVIRFAMPQKGKTEFIDLVRGAISFQNNLIDDQVLLKSDGFPTYHLAVVVDDYLMKITHVIRGEDWISSTPKYVQISKAFGYTLPQFAHLPLLRNTNKSKLSKRKDPVWLYYYHDQGFLPEALVNYLLTIGWSHPEEKTIFPISEAINKFSFDRVGVTGPIFDIKKLEWMNGEYIRQTQNSKLKTQIWEFLDKKYPQDLVEKIVPLIKERIKKLSDVEQLIDFFITQPKVDKKLLIPKKRTEEETKQVLENVLKSFAEIREWDAKTIHELGNKLVIKTGWKPIELFQTIRVAISGKTITPPLFESMEILGKKKTIDRLNHSFNPMRVNLNS